MAVTTARGAGRTGVLRLVLTDVTDSKLFEQALQKTNLALESAKAVAEKAAQAKSEFLSSMSHELRSPLNAVIGFAQLIATGAPPLSAEQKTSVDQILKAGWHLLHLISEILDLAMIESRKFTIQREPMSVGDVIEECLTMMEPQAQMHEIQLTFLRPESPIHVNADRKRVKQVIINLLSNAIKYGKVGGAVMIEFAKTAGNGIRINIRDNGVGMAPEQLEHLFQVFNRVGKDRGAEEGAGIGLVITKQLVELMGGSVGAASRVGVGSEFWVELPA
jgi:signal transduction histidine kinase